MKATYDVTLTCPACAHEFTVEAHYAHDPGVHTFPNGDPGYPEDTECWLEDADECPECSHEFTDGETEAFIAHAIDRLPDPDDDYYGPDTLEDAEDY